MNPMSLQNLANFAMSSFVGIEKTPCRYADLSAGRQSGGCEVLGLDPANGVRRGERDWFARAAPNILRNAVKNLPPAATSANTRGELSGPLINPCAQLSSYRARHRTRESGTLRHPYERKGQDLQELVQGCQLA